MCSIYSVPNFALCTIHWLSSPYFKHCPLVLLFSVLLTNWCTQELDIKWVVNKLWKLLQFNDVHYDKVCYHYLPTVVVREVVVRQFHTNYIWLGLQFGFYYSAFGQ